MLDLVPMWAAILALAVFMYVLLDGFDLGVGMVFLLRRDPGQVTAGPRGKEAVLRRAFVAAAASVQPPQQSVHRVQRARPQ